MRLVKYVIVTFLVGSHKEIKNLLPAIQAQFPHIRAIERFCVAGSNKINDRGHSRY